MRKSLFFPLVLLTAVLASGQTRAVKTNVGLMDLRASGISTKDAKFLTERFIIELQNTGRFAVMERDKRDEILKEQGFQQTGACDQASCLVEAGRLLPIQKMIGGSVGKIGNTYSIQIRMLDLRTGEVEKTAAKDYTQQIDYLLTTGMKEVANELAQSSADAERLSAADSAAAEQARKAREAERQRAMQDSLALSREQAAKRQRESERQKQRADSLEAEMLRRKQGIKNVLLCPRNVKVEAYIVRREDTLSYNDNVSLFSNFNINLAVSKKDFPAGAWFTLIRSGNNDNYLVTRYSFGGLAKIGDVVCLKAGYRLGISPEYRTADSLATARDRSQGYFIQAIMAGKGFGIDASYRRDLSPDAWWFPVAKGQVSVKPFFMAGERAVIKAGYAYEVNSGSSWDEKGRGYIFETEIMAARVLGVMIGADFRKYARTDHSTSQKLEYSFTNLNLGFTLNF